MPEPRRTEVRARFADAVAKIEAAGLLPEARAFDSLPDEQYLALHPRYFALQIACPFLEDESCSIYSQRPLVCREYLVTSPAEYCFEETSPKRAPYSLAGLSVAGRPPCWRATTRMTRG